MQAKVQLLQYMHSRGVALNDTTAYAAAHVFEQMSAMAPLRSSLAAGGSHQHLPLLRQDQCGDRHRRAHWDSGKQ